MNISRGVEDAAPYNQTLCMRIPVEDGSRLLTRSNRKTIAAGNLQPRPPTHTNKRRKLKLNDNYVKRLAKC